MSEFKELINHIMGCDNCFAPNDRYCNEGIKLKIQHHARFVAEQKTLEQRRYWMEHAIAGNPGWEEELKAAVAEKYKGSSDDENHDDEAGRRPARTLTRARR